MDFRIMGYSPLFHTHHHMMDLHEDNSDNNKTPANAASRTYVRDAKAMAATPADIKEDPKSYIFVVDMPGLKSGDIKVQVEDDNVLLISGERKREEEKDGSKYVRMERRVGKFMRKFVLPENANTDAVSAVCQDGVLTVTVEKLPPPQPKQPKTIEEDYTESMISGIIENPFHQANEVVLDDFSDNGSHLIQGPHDHNSEERAESNERYAFKTKSEVEILDDGYRWKKYGKKMVKNSPNPRNYYKCSIEGCSVKKRVERDKEDPSYVITTYEGIHNHHSAP